MKELIERLRRMVDALRRTPLPICDVIPALQQSADALESLTAERDELKLNHNICKGAYAQVMVENAALRVDSERLDWIECRAMNGNIEIARSIMKTGYEFGIHAPEDTTVMVKNGTLRQAIDAAIGEKHD